MTVGAIGGLGGAVTLKGTSVTVNATVSTSSGAINIDAASGATLNANLRTAGGAITLTGPVTVGTPANVSLDTTNVGASPTGANITITGAVNDDGSASFLTTDAGTSGTVDFQSTIGAGNALDNLDLATSANATFDGNVTVTNRIDAEDTDVTFGGGETLTANGFEAQSLVVPAAGATLSATTQIGDLSFSSGTLNVNDLLRLTGTWNWSGGSTLDGNGTGTFVIAGRGDCERHGE